MSQFNFGGAESVTLPPDIQRVIDVAVGLAGEEGVRFDHVYQACQACCPGHMEDAHELCGMFLDHLQAELDAGVASNARNADRLT